MSLTQGLTLGKYTILSPIDKGGMGTVWKAQAASQLFAIKEILKPTSRAVERLKIEAYAAQQVQSEHVARTVEIIEESKEHYLVQEFVEGQDFKKVLSLNKLPVEDAIRFLRHCSSALIQLHASNIVHRDLKPANLILRSSTNSAVLVDLGIARLEEHSITLGLTPPGVCVGTIIYSSPEQFKSSDIGKESDIFSLGCVFFEMLTARQLFPIKNQYSGEYFSNRDELDQNDCVELNQIPDVCRRIITGVVRKEPAQRLKLTKVLGLINEWENDQKQAIIVAKNSWSAHWLQVILQALINHWGPNQVRSRLPLAPEELRDALRSTSINSRVSGAIESLITRLNPPLLHSGILNKFLAQQYDESGLIAQLKLLNPKTTNEFHKQLIAVIEERLEFQQAKWKSGQLREIHSRLEAEAQKIREGGYDASGNYVNDLNKAYAIVSLSLGAQDISKLTRADFSSTRWMGIIDDDPEQVTSHLRFSNQMIARDVAEKLAPTARADGRIQMIDCGVGGGHSTYFILRELERTLGDARWTVEFRGYELVPDLAHLANSLVAGEMRGSDSRVDLFNRLHGKSRLQPLIQNDQKFIENNSFDIGLKYLRQDLIEERRNPSVDLIYACYSFHHLPNGELLRNYLRGTGKSSLANATRKFKDEFVSAVSAGCKDIREYKYVRPVNMPKYGPARVFLSLFNHLPLEVRDDWDDFLNFLTKGLPQNNWRFDERFLMVVANLQDEFIRHAHALLVQKNGLLVIGDPDGTSGFNLDKIADDPEISIGNFLSLEQLATKLKQSRKWIVEEMYTIGQKKAGSYYRYKSKPMIGVLKDGEDMNRGFYLIARAVGPQPFISF
jgi:serine/threonine protein kinase